MNFLALDSDSTVSHAFTADTMYDARLTITRDGQSWYDDGSDHLDVPVIDGDIEAAAQKQGWYWTGQIHDGWEIWKS